MGRQRKSFRYPTIDITSVFDLFAFLPILAPILVQSGRSDKGYE